MWQQAKNVWHLLLAMGGSFWFGFPSKRLRIIGVTGTDGKTTTVNLIYHMLKTAGYSVSMISSVGATIHGKQYNIGFHVTTPSALAIQKFLKMAVNTQAKNYLVLEVTSHGLDQYRVWGIDFEVAVLTNITNEHLDYHKTYENYIQTKFKLLRGATGAVFINTDDQSYKTIQKLKVNSSDVRQHAKWITYGLRSDADVNPKVFPFKTQLIGEFNQYNCLAAIGVCTYLGIAKNIMEKALLSFIPPKGRIEVVHEDDFTVMVDFAHTPNALERLLRSLRKETKGRIIHVFGSAGERDTQKRPKMGRISSECADVIIVTAEDPRSETVETITDEIESGMRESELRKKNQTYFRIPDRQEAINLAIALAEKGDMVVITGKGHEQSMNFGSGEEPWSDHQAIENGLKVLKKT